MIFSALLLAPLWVRGFLDLLPSLAGGGVSGLDSFALVQLCPWSSSCPRHMAPSF